MKNKERKHGFFRRSVTAHANALLSEMQDVRSAAREADELSNRSLRYPGQLYLTFTASTDTGDDITNVDLSRSEYHAIRRWLLRRRRRQLRKYGIRA